MDRSDIETIAFLVREYGNQNIPVFSRRLMRKIEESLMSYRKEDEVLRGATKILIPTMIIWPPGTEKYSNGPFFV